MNGLSLFSGAGIGELAFKQILPNYRTVGYVEWDKYCQQLLKQRIEDGVLDEAPIYGDIRSFISEGYAERYRGMVDWLSGGFPCQPFSVAGRNAGEADERNMWPATRDAISIIRPRYALLENVPGLFAHKYIRRIFGDLAEIGYDCEWDTVSAAFVGANHLRKRVWILAYPNRAGQRKRRRAQSIPAAHSGVEFDGQNVSNSDQYRCNQRGQGFTTSGGNGTIRNPWWSTEPGMGRVVNGLAKRVDRLKALGNGWVPQVVRRILDVCDQ